MIFGIGTDIVDINRINEIDSLDREIKKVNAKIEKLKYNFNFLESEWEVIASPENIEKLVKKHFDHEKASLINKEVFFSLLNADKEK